MPTLEIGCTLGSDVHSKATRIEVTAADETNPIDHPQLDVRIPKSLPTTSASTIRPVRVPELVRLQVDDNAVGWTDALSFGERTAALVSGIRLITTLRDLELRIWSRVCIDEAAGCHRRREPSSPSGSA